MGLGAVPALEQFPVFPGAVDAEDVLIHHFQTVHYSEPNRSARPRLSLVIVYCGAHTRADGSLQALYRASSSSE